MSPHTPFQRTALSPPGLPNKQKKTAEKNAAKEACVLFERDALLFSPEDNNSPLFQEFSSGIGSAPIGSLTGLGSAPVGGLTGMGFGGGVGGERGGEYVEETWVCLRQYFLSIGAITPIPYQHLLPTPVNTSILLIYLSPTFYQHISPTPYQHISLSLIHTPYPHLSHLLWFTHNRGCWRGIGNRGAARSVWGSLQA